MDRLAMPDFPDKEPALDLPRLERHMVEALRVSPLTEYEEGLRRGELRFQFSLAADRAFYPPRVLCPFTASDRIEWRTSAGRGTIYAHSIVSSRKDPSYAMTLIDLDEGFRMLSRIVDSPIDAVAIGARVRLAIRADGENGPVPFFTVADATHE